MLHLGTEKILFGYNRNAGATPQARRLALAQIEIIGLNDNRRYLWIITEVNCAGRPEKYARLI
jgi:hypothetical protein